MTYHIALYGKGGVGKTTLAANIGAALVEAGFKIMLVGCDPEGDSCASLNEGVPIPAVLDLIRNNTPLSPVSVVYSGYKGISCVELGDSTRNGKSASAEIAGAFEALDRIRLFEVVSPDIVIYDISGDISCAGLISSIHHPGLSRLFVVTSADFKSLQAANSIFTLLERYGEGHEPIPMGGLIPNGITSSFEESFINDFASRSHVQTLGTVPRSLMVRQCELYGKTVIEAAPRSNQAFFYRRLANQIVDSVPSRQSGRVPQPMLPEQLRAWALEWADRIYALENGLVSDGAAI